VARAQAPYVGVGLGPTVVFNQAAGSKTVYRGLYGAIGIDWPSGVGVRLEGTETWGFLWLSTDLTYRFRLRAWPLQPYALAGGGLRIDRDNSDPIGTAGAGARLQLSPLLSLFGEGRVHYLPSLPSSPWALNRGLSCSGP
jgi:hypothetical protein